MLWDKDVLHFLLGMFEAGSSHHTYVDLKRMLPNQAVDEVCQLAFSPDGYEMFYPAEDMGDEDHLVEEIEPGKFAYFDRGWRPVAEQDIKRYRMDWLPKVLRTELHLSGEMQEIVPERLWLLGELRHAETNTPIWLSRGLSHGGGFDSVYDALAARSHQREGVILCSSAPVSQRLELPGSYRLINPIELLNRNGYLSSEVLVGIAAPGTSRQDSPLHWDSDNGLLHIKGDVIRFTGEKRRHVITLLYDRCLKAENKWNIQALLEEIDSSSTHISKLFKNHKRWRDMTMVCVG